VGDALTTTGSVDFDQTAYDRLAYFALRPELHFEQVASVKPTRQAMPGSIVSFTLVDDLAVASTALDESTDVDTVALADNQVTVTLIEYGNAVKTTAKLRGTSFVEVDPIVANVVGFNAGISIDTVARDVLKAGDNVRYATGGTTDPDSRDTVEADDTLIADDVRRILADLRGANAPTVGGDYAAWIHPDVSYDLRGTTSASLDTWLAPAQYVNTDRIWNGEIGKFQGFRFVETPRAPVFADAGSSTTLTDVYATIFAGNQALAKAWSYTDGNGAFPKVVPGPITDDLRRFIPLGWYWLGGFSRFREACLRRVESSSSIGDNA
jgi:N4-gp56 family major capsid protein